MENINYYEWLDENSVRVVAYDVDEDPDHELCAVYIRDETGQKAHLVTRHSREAGKQNQHNCEDFKNLDKKVQKRFEDLKSEMHKKAMYAFNYKDTPPQMNLPM